MMARQQQPRVRLRRCFVDQDVRPRMLERHVRQRLWYDADEVLLERIVVVAVRSAWGTCQGSRQGRVTGLGGAPDYPDDVLGLVTRLYEDRGEDMRVCRTA